VNATFLILCATVIFAPVFGMEAQVPAAKTAPAKNADGGKSPTAYLFSYFTGNGEDGLHLAWSADGYKWGALNDGRSYLRPLVGESKLMRDPCILCGPDGTYHLVWTTAWAGVTIGHATSKDLIHWSEEQAIPVMTNEPGVANCWAPEVAYDDKKQDFVIFWATTIAGKFPETLGTAEQKNNHRMYSTTTRDFVTFTPTRLFYDPGFVVIDATFLRADQGLFLIFKDETLKPVRKHLRMVSAAGYEGPFSDMSAPFTQNWVEGPTALKVGNDYVVYYDCYRDHHYGAVRSSDLKNWQDITAQISFPKNARHGTVITVPETVLAKLKSGPQ